MDPIMIDFPNEFVTERLLIRTPKPGDGKAVGEAGKAIPLRLSFELEGVIRNEDLSVDGTELRDTYIFAKIKECKDCIS